MDDDESAFRQVRSVLADVSMRSPARSASWRLPGRQAKVQVGQWQNWASGPVGAIR